MLSLLSLLRLNALMLGLVQAFILLLVIMDPVLSLAAFLSFTKGMKNKDRMAVAVKGVLVAAAIFLFFALWGSNLLDLLHVTMDGFKAAGGIVLILLGIQLSMGISFPKEKNREEISSLAVVIGTPLISGPATITTTIILVSDFGLAVTLLAGIAALIIVLLSLLGSRLIGKLLGFGGLRVLSTMMGIVTLAWGMQFLIEGASALL